MALPEASSPSPQRRAPPITAPMAAAIAQALAKGRLRRWRVGYSFYPQHPFVAPATVESLIERRLLRRSRKGAATVYPTAAAQAALEAFRAEAVAAVPAASPAVAPRAWWIEP